MITAESQVKIISGGVMLLVCILALITSVFTTSDGSVTIVSSFGKAHTVATPGLGFKVPVKDSVESISIRPRKLTETFQGSSLPPTGSDSIGIAASLVVSVNWTPIQEGILDLYVRHGKLENFEAVILETRMQDAVKAASATFSPKDMLGRRSEFAGTILSNIRTTLPDYAGMVKINSIQVDNVGFPPSYLAEVEAEQVASKQADKALQATRQKANENQQIVDLATTNKERRVLEADAAAYEVTTAANAEAEAVKAIGDAELEVLREKAKLVTPELTRMIEMERWDGVRSTHVLGTDSNVLLNSK